MHLLGTVKMFKNFYKFIINYYIYKRKNTFVHNKGQSVNIFNIGTVDGAYSITKSSIIEYYNEWEGIL